MKYEKSCGNVVFRENDGLLEVLLVHHNLGHWGIPKGHVEDGETEQETAVREVYEETGISSIVIPGFREKITYSPKEGVEKDVIFFIGKPEDAKLVPQLTEVSEARFVEVDKAIELITHMDEKELLNNAINYYRENIR